MAAFLTKRTNLRERVITLHLGFLFALTLLACGRPSRPDCAQPAVNTTVLEQIRTAQVASPGKGFFNFPNPAEATGNANASGTDAASVKAQALYNLPNLASAASLLDNSILGVRINNIQDNASLLARPNAQGEFRYAINDTHYSETLVYFAMNSLRNFAKEQGFNSGDQKVYAVVRSNITGNTGEVNAFFQDNDTAPTIHFVGDGVYAPSNDGGVSRHEYGHKLVETISARIGIDRSVQKGGVFGYGRAIHEAMADFFAMSMSGKPQIGNWISHNFQGYQGGEPLRSAVDTTSKKLQFQDVATTDGTTVAADNYAVSEWLTRVLWDIRSEFVADDATKGTYWMQRLVYASISKLRQDSSMAQFRDALVQTDSEIFCGFDKDRIQTAFANRGFKDSGKTAALGLDVYAIPFRIVNGSAQTATLAPGVNVLFAYRVRNSNAAVASNVEVSLETDNSKLIVQTYKQGIGEMIAGSSFNVDGQTIPLDYALFAMIDQNAAAGQSIAFRVRVTSANAPEQTFQGQLNL